MNSIKYSRIVAAIAVSTLAACGGGGGGGGGGVTTPPAQNTPPSFSSPVSFSFAENTAVDFVLTVTDPDSSTVTITDDSTGDGALFTVDATSGRVTANTVNGAFDFESPQDANGDNVYEQNVTLSDGQNTVTQTITVTITEVDEPPVFTNPSTVSLNENATGVIATFVAEDPETGVLSSDYAISQVSKLGEVVNAQRLLDAFEVNPATGELSVVIPFDAELEGTQDTISVEIQASDGNLLGAGSLNIQLVDLEARVVSGIQYAGRDTINRLGEYAEQVGDIDQDGLNEFWVGESTDEAGVETAYLIWGDTVRQEMVDGFGDRAIDTLTESEAIRFTNDDRSQTDKRTLMQAISAGDVDGDGRPDLLISLVESRVTVPNPDIVDGPLGFVVWGDRLEALGSGAIDLQSLDSNDGINLGGLARAQNIQLSATSADIDADGQSDLVFGHPNQALVRVVYGTALGKGSASFDIASGSVDEVVVIRSETDTNILQQIGFHVSAITNLGSDSRPELVISGAALEPTLESGVYVISSEIVNSAKGTSGAVNVLDAANANGVIEMLGQEAAITGVSTAGDIDNDGVNDLALSHIGNFENTLVATVVFGSTLAGAFDTGTDPSLLFNDPAEGINVRVSGQIFTQTTDANVTVKIIPDVAGGAGADLLIGLGEDSRLGRTNSGSISILTDTAIVALPDAEVTYPFNDFPASLGRTFAGPTSGARAGSEVFVSDLDGDSRPDISLAGVGAGPADNGFSNGAYLFYPGTELEAAFNNAEAQTDMATALSNETP